MIIFALFFLFGSFELKAYVIAQDPSWYPLELFNKERNVTAYADALINQIQERENVTLSVLSVDSVNLLSGLERNLYDGALSGIRPLLSNEQVYDFSMPFLLLGPVLVLPFDASETSLTSFSGKRVGVYAMDNSILVAQSYPVFIQTYSNIPIALQQLAEGSIDALLLPKLAAQSFIPALYPNRLKIASRPLNDEGLRLVTLKNQSLKLQKIFSKNLKQFQKNGTLKKLQQKYNVN